MSSILAGLMVTPIIFSFVHDTLTKEILYNQDVIRKHYSQIELSSLDSVIEELVDTDIMEYFGQCGSIRNFLTDLIILTDKDAFCNGNH